MTREPQVELNYRWVRAHSNLLIIKYNMGFLLMSVRILGLLWFGFAHSCSFSYLWRNVMSAEYHPLERAGAD